jgi:hypothetical protein
MKVVNQKPPVSNKIWARLVLFDLPSQNVLNNGLLTMLLPRVIYLYRQFFREASMCCISTIILVLGSRIGIFVWWLSDQHYFALAFNNGTFLGNITLPVWVWTLLGGIFLPWTTLAYLFLFSGGIVGYEWIVLGIAFLFDLAGHGGSYRHRNRFPGYGRNNQTI